MISVLFIAHLAARSAELGRSPKRYAVVVCGPMAEHTSDSLGYLVIDLPEKGPEQRGAQRAKERKVAVRQAGG
jgi:hypothetical protein